MCLAHCLVLVEVADTVLRSADFALISSLESFPEPTLEIGPAVADPWRATEFGILSMNFQILQ